MFSRRKFGLYASLLATVGLTSGALLATSAAAEPVIGEAAPAFEGTTTKGETVSLSDYAEGTVVLEWTNHDCPYVKKHYVKTDNMQTLQTDWTAKGVTWLQVISSAPGKQGYVSAEEAEAIAAERGAAPSAIILDPEGEIGRAYDARTTPHMYVIKDGVLAYQGAIDDKPTSREADVAGATNYVTAALTALENGQEVEVTESRAYGCTVKYAS